jgi:hypothetical protein
MRVSSHLLKLSVAAGAVLVLSTSCGPGWDTHSPLIQEMAGMQKLIVKLRAYSETNSTPFNWQKAGNSVDALVAVGALSPTDADYIRVHKLQFRGFDPTRISGEVPVFELVFTNSSKPPRLIIGHSDGSVAVRNLQPSK